MPLKLVRVFRISAIFALFLYTVFTPANLSSPTVNLRILNFVFGKHVNIEFCLGPDSEHFDNTLNYELYKSSHEYGILVTSVNKCFSNISINSYEVSESIIMVFFSSSESNYHEICHQISRSAKWFGKKTMPTFIIFFEQFGNETTKRIPKFNFPINVGVYGVHLNLYIHGFKIFNLNKKVDISEVDSMPVIPGYFSATSDLSGFQLNTMGIREHVIHSLRDFRKIPTLPQRDLWSYTNFLLFRDLKTLLKFTEGELNISSSLSVENAFKAGVDLEVFQKIMLPKNVTNFQYLHAAYSIKFRLFFIQPPTQSLRSIFEDPFQSSLWFAVFLTFLLILSAVNVIQKFDGNDGLTSLDPFLWTLSAVCQQGWYRSPSTFKLRTIAVATLLTSVTLYMLYSAAIISQLVKVISVKSLQDLIKYSFVIGSFGSTGELTAVKNIKEIVKVKTVIIPKTENVMNRIQISRTAFLTYPHSFYDNIGASWYDRSNLCQAMPSVVVDTVPYPEAMIMPKGSQFKEPFNQKILFVKERGLFRRYSNYYDNGLALSCGRKKMIYSVGCADIFVVYLILTGGIAVGLMSLFVEYVLNMFGRKKLRYYP